MARQDALLRLHKSLIARRTELRKRLGFELEELAHVKHSSASGDAADAAFDASGEEISSTLAELEAKELAQIERALRRLKAGTYGKCEVCSIKIPVARLNALPFSTFCVDCQREMERDGGWSADYSANGWDRIRDGDPMADREVRISDLESDLSK
ncbi:TraR/DksA C4-type zinc finger protein [Gemmata sp. JC673]|uniref:TraR/DksA C4-type zinc finger protein n=1 Tax=Gemmata algarum TaxID=2975278 RepID=A0ABU5F492_9BACT|nr:TraR/DksA C4-type zinc finger protein [Gemmata algarum]MDY3562360.1 TraR/DksA C4-type zinc finger protein [Gemmata algarum]